jgi:hypothetical protein
MTDIIILQNIGISSQDILYTHLAIPNIIFDLMDASKCCDTLFKIGLHLLAHL